MGKTMLMLFKFTDVGRKIHFSLKETEIRVSSLEVFVLIKEKIVLHWNKSLVLLPNHQFTSTVSKARQPVGGSEIINKI